MSEQIDRLCDQLRIKLHGIAFELAIAAVDQAAQATLEALLARSDATRAALPAGWAGGRHDQARQ